jgi:tripartite-type tricarboxylate transporter receptor subunit TctC
MGRDIPLVTDFAKTEADRTVVNLINSGIAFGRPILLPPDVPVDRVEALRKAFDQTVKDPAFIADAKAQNADPIPVTGKRLQELAIQAAASGPEIVARVNELTKVQGLQELKK